MSSGVFGIFVYINLKRVQSKNCKMAKFKKVLFFKDILKPPVSKKTIPPQTEKELRELILEGERQFEPNQHRLWELIRIKPERWSAGE